MHQKPASLTRIALALACASPLSAIAGDGWYLGLEGGANFLSDQSVKIYGDTGLLGVIGGVPDGTEVAKTKAKTGWVAGAVAGYSFGNGLRPELEYSYRHNKFDSVKLNNGTNTSNVDGTEKMQAGFANLWYDFLKSSSFHPYIGGGVGYGQVKLTNPAYNNNTLRNYDDSGFMYQGGAGLSYDLSYHWALSVDYRYVSGIKNEYDLVVNSPNTTVKSRYEAQSVLLSLRYSFASPAAPVPAPAEPVAVVPAPALPPPPKAPCKTPEAGEKVDLSGCAAGDVIVLRGVNFEFDKARLTVNAKTLLDDVVAALQARPDIKVEIDGHTDSTGTDAYNQKLSERRAAAVVAYLTEHGIDAARLSSKGFGESQPMADNATSEGRELNRRVALKVTESQEPAPAATDAAPSTDAAAPAAPADAAAVPAADAAAAPVDAAAAPAEAAAPADAATPAAADAAASAPAADAPAGEAQALPSTDVPAAQ